LPWIVYIRVLEPVLPPFGVLSLESRVSPTCQLEPTDIAKFGSLDVAAYDLLAWEIIPSPCILLKSASCPCSTMKVTERLLGWNLPEITCTASLKQTRMHGGPWWEIGRHLNFRGIAGNHRGNAYLNFIPLKESRLSSPPISPLLRLRLF
jgi:hypothetical protein